MASVAPVDGYGQITNSNAPEIYTAYVKGDVELDDEQEKYCIGLLPPGGKTVIDNVGYSIDPEDTDNVLNEGEGTEESQENQKSSNAGAIVNGSTLSAISAAAITMSPIAIAADGFTQLVLGKATTGLAIISIPLAATFDSDYNERMSTFGEADNIDGTIDDYSESLSESMEEMSDNIDIMNDEIESQEGVVAEEEVPPVENVEQEAANPPEGFDEIGNIEDSLAEYEDLEEASVDESENDYSTSEFLESGSNLGGLAAASAGLLAGATVATAKAAATCVPKIAPMFPDMFASVTAKVLFEASAASFGTSSAIMIGKSVDEFECGSKGDDMKGHVDELSELLSEQEASIDETADTLDTLNGGTEGSQGTTGGSSEGSSGSTSGGGSTSSGGGSSGGGSSSSNS